MVPVFSLLPGVLPGLPKERLQFTPRSASTPCLFPAAEPELHAEHEEPMHRMRGDRQRQRRRRGDRLQRAKRLHLPGLQPNATAPTAPGLAFGETSGHMLAEFSQNWEL